MKNIILPFLLFLLSILSLSVFSDEIKETNWQPIYGLKYHGAEAFIDLATLKSSYSNPDDDLSTGNILIVSAEPKELVVAEKTHIIRSVVKSIMVSCKYGVMVPVYDLYFVSAKPLRTETPVTGYKYTGEVKEIAIQLTKSSLIYTTFCPKYI